MTIKALRRNQKQDQDGRVKNPELTSPHKHIKATTTYTATLTENNMKTSRKALLQPRL